MVSGAFGKVWDQSPENNGKGEQATLYRSKTLTDYVPFMLVLAIGNVSAKFGVFGPTDLFSAFGARLILEVERAMVIRTSDTPHLLNVVKNRD